MPVGWNQWRLTVLASPCGGFENLYEKQLFGPFGSGDQGEAYVQSLVDDNILDASLAGRDITDPGVRSALRMLSNELNIAPLYPTSADVTDGLTPELDAELELM